MLRLAYVGVTIGGHLLPKACLGSAEWEISGQRRLSWYTNGRTVLTAASFSVGMGTAATCGVVKTPRIGG